MRGIKLQLYLYVNDISGECHFALVEGKGHTLLCFSVLNNLVVSVTELGDTIVFACYVN